MPPKTNKSVEGVAERLAELEQQNAAAVVISPGSPESMRLSAAQAISNADFMPLAKDYSLAHKLPLQTALGFVQRAHEVFTGHVELGKKYITLCSWIREHKIGPAQVSAMLAGLGFHKVRISEVNKIATVSDELWSKFSARELGMKKVLQIARGSTALDALDLDEEEKKDAGLASADERRDTKPKRIQETHVVRVAKLVKSLQALCGKEPGKYKTAKVFDKHGSGIVVTVQFSAAVKEELPAEKK